MDMIILNEQHEDAIEVISLVLAKFDAWVSICTIKFNIAGFMT